MKTIIAALALATLIAVPAFIQSAAAAPGAGGYYQGYPLEQWYRPDGW
jgi:hypothetical protein